MGVKETSNNLGFQQFTSLSSATALTMPAYAGNGYPQMVLIQIEGQPVRWRDDGTDPTPTVGMLLPVGGELCYDGDLMRLRIIQTTGGAIANVTYYN